jgi:hypothetical protein
MATGIFFITIKIEAQTTSFRHLVQGEVHLVALAVTLLGGHRRGRERQRLLGHRERWPERGSGKEATRGARGGGCTGRSISINSTWRTRLMVAASVSGLWMRTAWLSGGRSLPVKSCTC